MREVQIIASTKNDYMGIAPNRVYKWLQRHQFFYVSGYSEIDGQEYCVTFISGTQEMVEKFKKYLKIYPFDPKGRFAFKYSIAVTDIPVTQEDVI